MLCSVLFCSVVFIFSFPFHVFSWANNCAANNKTNGVDNRSGSSDASLSQHRGARAARMDITHPNTRISRPDLSQSALTATNGSAGVIKSFILPRNKTGVVRLPSSSHLLRFSPDNISSSGFQMFIGSFEGDFNQFQLDVDAAVQQFKASGVTNLLIDVTNNGGSFAPTIKCWKD